MSRSITVIVSNDLVPNKPDLLLSDCLRIEMPDKVVLKPGVASQVNLMVHNTSNVGRQANLSANFDTRLVSVYIPDQKIYIGPNGKTATFAVITPRVPSGTAPIQFSVI
jgi:hypothetical protein